MNLPTRSALKMKCYVVLLLSFVPLLSSVDASDIKSIDSDASTRAEQTLQGLLHYYWLNDAQQHKHPNVRFFLVCGQIGNPDYNNSCTCGSTPGSCVNCYRWYDGVTLESVATYGIYMKTKANAHVADITYAHSPYNAKWNATALCTFMDDFSWYGIAYLRVYEWLKDPKWLNRSIALFDWVWQYGWDKPCGGFWWTNCDANLFKDSITIVEMMHFSSKLANMFPDELRYLERAQLVWDWFFSFDNGYGLMSDKYLVSTGAVPEKCCNATSANPSTRCHNSKVSGTAYNQGLLISTSANLYLRTGNQTYLDVGLRAVEAILKNYTTKEGILIDEPRSYQSYQYQCTSGQDPGGDWYSFNGIFMLHLGYFTELLHENGSLPTDTYNGVMSLIKKTSDAAWNRSAVWPPFNQTKDACNIGIPKLSSNVTYPKFHWWWGRKVVQQTTPPDPRQFFHRTGLRCYTYEDDQLWEGLVNTELDCIRKCADDPLCSSYLFDPSESYAGTNCWIWNYNRNDHACNLTDYWKVGIKRPVGEATCAGRCGSKEPLKLDHGVCYCDSDCAKHLDCCLDYADRCLAGKPASCKGNCDDVYPHPVPGGGYCWCLEDCNPWMTDNNSDGSCCPDYPEHCEAIRMPTCLDARTQGSALNLFLAHLKLAQIAAGH